MPRYSATVTGQLTDTTGAVIPHVAVIATDQNTGVSVKVESNDSGQFNLQFLKAGTYTITVESPGFRKYIKRDIALSGGDHPTIDVSLQVGDIGQTVEVSTESQRWGRRTL